MRENTMMYRIMVVAIATVLLVFGIYIGLKVTNESKSNEVSITNEETTEVNSSNDNTDINNTVPTNVNVYEEEKKDIEVVYEDTYTLCNETVVESNMYYGATKEDIKKQEEDKQEEDGKEYKISSETDTKIVYSREVNTYCPYHFEVKIEDSKVAIYNLVDKEKKTLFKQTDIEEKWVRSELVEELKKGIIVNSLDELNSLIEDLES